MRSQHANRAGAPNGHDVALAHKAQLARVPAIQSMHLGFFNNPNTLSTYQVLGSDESI